MLKQLDDKVIATGLIGGALGMDIQEKLTEMGIENHFFEISGETRNCIAILHEGNQTEILENGPTISQSESEKFLEYFEILICTRSKSVMYKLKLSHIKDYTILYT